MADGLFGVNYIISKSRVWVPKPLLDKINIKNGLKRDDALLPLLFNFGLEYAMRRVQVNQEGLKLNGTHQPLVYAYVIILGGSILIIKKNNRALVFSSKETGLEVNANKTKYMVMSLDQMAGRDGIVKIFGNKSKFYSGRN
jgi:hypothetical protein